MIEKRDLREWGYLGYMLLIPLVMSYWSVIWYEGPTHNFAVIMLLIGGLVTLLFYLAFFLSFAKVPRSPWAISLVLLDGPVILVLAAYFTGIDGVHEHLAWFFLGEGGAVCLAFLIASIKFEADGDPSAKGMAMGLSLVSLGTIGYLVGYPLMPELRESWLSLGLLIVDLLEGAVVSFLLIERLRGTGRGADLMGSAYLPAYLLSWAVIVGVGMALR